MLKRKTQLKTSGISLKKIGNTIKRKSMLRSKAPDPKYLLDRKAQSEKDWQMYTEIWNEREHKCIICSGRIYGELKNLYMDHILEKSIYPELRYEKGNIAVVCSQCHTNKDGNRPERYQELIDDTKKKFNII